MEKLPRETDGKAEGGGVLYPPPILRGIESSTRTIASIGYFQFCWALGSYVTAACLSFAVRVGRSYGEREIESINERDVIEIFINNVDHIKSIFSRHCRKLSITLTIEQVAAVTSVVATLPAHIEEALSSQYVPRFYLTSFLQKR